MQDSVTGTVGTDRVTRDQGHGGDLSRRRLLETLGCAGAAGVVAGCFDGAGGDVTKQPPCPDPPGAETDPKDLLPEARNGWKRTETRDVAADTFGAEVGVTGVYQAPFGDEYSVELLRWPSEEDAQDGVEESRGSGDTVPTLRLVLGRFTFVVSGLGEESARTLLEDSPALTADCVEARAFVLS